MMNTASNDDIIPSLIEFIAREILQGEEDLDAHTPLLALGVIDSLSMVSLLGFIQKRFQVDIPDDLVTVENFEDVASLAQLIGDRMATRGPLDAVERSPMERAVHALRAAGVTSETHTLKSGERIHSLSVTGDQGPTWVMLPGLGNPASSWGHMLKALAGEHPATAIDLAGFGLSTGRQRPHYLDHVTMLEELFEQRFAGEPLLLVGSSAGCLIALEYARRHPNRVAAVALLGFGLIADPEGWMRDLDSLWKRPEEFLARTYHTPPRLNELLLEQFEAVYQMDAYHSYLRAADLGPEVFDNIEVPVLVLGGTSDRIIGVEAIRSAARRIPGAELVELARCGHFPGSERPEETVYTIDNFLSRRLASASVPSTLSIGPVSGPISSIGGPVSSIPVSTIPVSGITGPVSGITGPVSGITTGSDAKPPRGSAKGAA